MSADALASGWAKALGGDRKQFDMFFDKMLNGFAYHKIVVDKTGKPIDYVFLEVNHAFEQMTGLKREHILGKKVTDALPGIEKETANWIGVYGRVALTGEPVQFENYNEALCKWFKVVAYSPEKGYFAALFEDITERRKAEEELRAGEERYRHLVQYAPTAIYEIDFVNQRFKSVNDAMCIMSGYSRGELLAMNPISNLVPQSQIRFKQRITKALAGEKVDENVDYKAIAKDGREFWFTLKMKLLCKDGRFYGAQVVAHDITEQKKAEGILLRVNEELEERVRKRTEEVSNERQRLFNVLEMLPAYVVLLDKDYRVPFANKVFRESFGESHGRRCHEYLFKLDSPCENCETYKVLKTHKFNHWEWTGPNGHDYDIYDYPFVEADGSTFILEMGIDVTERKKAEQQALESARKLKDAERLAAIGATAGMVGHDIRNPLQAIISDVFLAKTDLSSMPDSGEKKGIHESLTEIETNIDYINKIVQDLQDYARPLNPQLEKVQIKLAIEKLLAKNKLPKNVKMEIKIEDGIKEISADSYYLNRIMDNLVTNAVQAMPKGGKLVIHAYKEGNDTVLSVKDTGVGIPKEIQGKMFTLMFTTKAKGQGFGLPVVKRMTESLGGKISFESEEGKGTTFIIRFPTQGDKR
jgi:PAS domain S-box-containing protein